MLPSTPGILGMLELEEATSLERAVVGAAGV